MIRLIPFLALAVLSCAGPPLPPGTIHVVINADAPVAEVDPRFLSIAIDASEVMGGHWWTTDAPAVGGVGAGTVPPFDFARPRLARLAKELAPAFLRVGGSEADKAYYDLSDSPVATAPPPYALVLNHSEWDAMHAFAAAAGFDVFFTLNAGPGPRDANHAWVPDNARQLLAYSAAHHQPVAVWELGNEINAYPLVLGSADAVSAREYTADLGVAKALINELTPGARLAGPSSAYWPQLGEPLTFMPAFMPLGGAVLDIVTWHYYPQQSTRCPVALTPATPFGLLAPAALAEVSIWATSVETLQLANAPRAEVWLGETGNAQCGGAPGISDRFIASLWWLDELGRIARHGEKVTVRQTLSGADYGLLDDATLTPRPDYWASVLFKRLTGTKVLGVSGAPAALPVYAFCERSGTHGAVVAIAINLSQTASATVAFDGLGSAGAQVYALTADDPLGQSVKLNDTMLAAAGDGSPPAMNGVAASSSNGAARVTLPAMSAAFVALPGARAKGCE